MIPNRFLFYKNQRIKKKIKNKIGLWLVKHKLRDDSLSELQMLEMK